MTEQPPGFSETRMQEFLVYLDTLRESGVTNMFGAQPYLRQEFPDLTKTDSSRVLTYWMQTFSDRHKEG